MLVEGSRTQEINMQPPARGTNAHLQSMCGCYFCKSNKGRRLTIFLQVLELLERLLQLSLWNFSHQAGWQQVVSRSLILQANITGELQTCPARPNLHDTNAW